jgi:hypothetical protein
VSSPGPTYPEPRSLPSLSYPSCAQFITTTTATVGGAWCGAYGPATATTSRSLLVSKLAGSISRTHGSDPLETWKKQFLLDIL